MSMLMSSNERPAVLRYEQNGFRVLSAGSFVLCAVSGVEIPLSELAYWSADRQEAYRSAVEATKALLQQ